MIQPEDVTIIIPHLGVEKYQCDALKTCIDSLKETSPLVKRIVVKNGNVACFCDRQIRIIEQGQCKAVNAAVAITNTPWIMITNDDMIYPPHWFENLTSNLEYEKIMCISPKLIEPRPGAPTFETYFCGGAGGDFDIKKFYDFAYQYSLKSEEEKKLRTGFNLPFLISRDLWDLIGGYNVNYDPWGSNSDSDLEYKIKLAGVQPMQSQRAIVYHYSQTSGTFEPRNQPYWSKNWDYFIKVWGFPRTDSGIWEATFTIPTPEEGRVFEPWWEGFYAKESPMMRPVETL